ncbi:hypothetical protein [Pseudophaeobacter leonis]|uniref:hypothetical protein n=1 Tax=Pseudophaeobacter leonis TaxID=1144477 RepID=UPI0009F4E7CA|nr:hypothetical protein [Pseudophaeobacter leonis]
MEDLPRDLMSGCRDIVESAGANVQFFEDSASVEAIANLVAEGDRLQFDDPSFRRELASWTHSSRLGHGDGMSGAAFNMPDVLTPAARFVIRTFDLGSSVAAADKQKILSGSPALA